MASHVSQREKLGVAGCFLLLITGMTLESSFTIVAAQESRVDKSSERVAEQSKGPPLEIYLVKPPSWKNHCLEVSLNRLNRSKSAIFVPSYAGVHISSSVTDASDYLGRGKGQAWISVYGQSDIVRPDVTRLAPGEAKEDVYCILSSFPVQNSEGRRRQVLVQGRLRVYAHYFLEAPDWQISKQQREDMARTPPADWKNVNKCSGSTVTIEIPVPCRKEASETDCSTAPPIFRGERELPVPHVGECGEPDSVEVVGGGI